MKNSLKQPTKVCYILSYRDPQYIRASAQIRALARCSGLEVILATNSSKGVFRYPQTLWALLKAKFTEEPDLYILGFRGHEIFWLVRLLTRGKPLIFDALMSPYAALKFENKSGRIGRILAPMVRWLESDALRKSDIVLTDTQLHARFYSEEFGLAAEKIVVVPVGALEPNREICPSALVSSEFTVLFYGSFLPLHGVDIIVQAAGLLREYPIQFHFIGGDKKQVVNLLALCKKHDVARYTHRTWVPLDQLTQDEIPRASLCLGGPFGNTPQARRVITTKTSQCLALGKPTVIGNILEDIGFADKTNSLLVEQEKPEALAQAIRWCYEHPQELAQLGRRGQALYHEQLSVEVIATRLEHALKLAITRHEAGL